MHQLLLRCQSLLLFLLPQHQKPHHAPRLHPLQRRRLKKASLAGSKACLAVRKLRRPRLQLTLKKTNAASKPAAMVVQTTVRMGAVSVAVTANAVAATAAVADAAAAKVAAQKAALKAALKDARKAVLKTATTAATKAVVASAAQKRVLKVFARSVRTALLARPVLKHRAMTVAQTCKPVVMATSATKAALTTANRVSHVLRVRAVSARAANGATAQNVVTASRAMP